MEKIRLLGFVSVLLLSMLCPISSNADAKTTTVINQIIFTTDLPVTEMSKNYFEVFKKHLLRRIPNVMVLNEEHKTISNQSNLLRIIVNIGFENGDSPGDEGYELKIEQNNNLITAKIRADDERAVMFALGHLLRVTELQNNGFILPIFSEKTAPRYQVRGVNQNLMDKIDGSVGRKTEARAWNREDAKTYLEELFLQGQNIYLHGWGTSSSVSVKDYDPNYKNIRGVNLNYANIARDYGMMYFLGNSINGIGAHNMQDESWKAIVHRAPNKALACPSNPAAREMILKVRELYFKHCPRLDYVMLQPADIAGCECKKCTPWPLTYYKLCIELSKIIRRYHPDCKVLVSNQEFNIDDNKQFFELLRRDNSPDIDGYVYAPGCSENSSYGYIVPNLKYKNYPGVYPASTFLKSRMKYLSPNQNIMAMMDIGHWNRAQNSVARIDPIFSEIYHRRTFNVRPKAITKVWREVFPYSDQIVGYSETIVDDFMKYLTLRLAWNPDLDDKTITEEYYTYHCGTLAGKILAEAVFIGEQNYEKPVIGNEENIRLFHKMVEQAWSLMSEEYRRDNWRMLALRQRATADLYLLARMEAQQKLYDKVVQEITNKVPSKEDLLKLADSLQFKESQDLISLRQEVARLDDETNRIIGVRCQSVQKIANADNVGIHYLADRLRLAAKEITEVAMLEHLKETINYDKVNDGEFYDNCGTPDRQPHFDFSSGELYYGTGSWPENARPSQRYYNYTFERQAGLRFVYNEVDKKALYRVELIYPNPKGVSFALNSPNVFEVFADNQRIGEGHPSGNGFDRFVFDIPFNLTSDGSVNIEIKKKAGEAVSTCISEIWIKKR